MLTLDEALGRIQEATDLDGLQAVFMTLSQQLGFASFSYIDVRALRSGEVMPFYQTSVSQDFARVYQDEGFILIDPVFNRAATTNAPFRWADLPEFIEPASERSGRSRQVLNAANDHGYTEGYVLPLHAIDLAGRPASSLISLYWTERPADMTWAVPNWLRLVALAYHERVLMLRGARDPIIAPTLTSRERDCMSWACRGKTITETAIILNISDRTVKFHMENAMHKLGVHNKFHAIAMAIHLGLISP